MERVRAAFLRLTGHTLVETLANFGLGMILIVALLFILAARTADHYASHACIHPTAMPTTWFGDCNRRGVNTSVHSYPAPRGSSGAGELK